MTIKSYLSRHFPAPWWMYPRSPYRLHDPSTYHHRHDPVNRITDGVRTAAGAFWWSWFWSGVWAAVAALFVTSNGLPFWPCFAVFVLGECAGRCTKDEQRALLELRSRESDLAMAKEGIRE